MHIEIQQGTLLPGGKIDENSVYWKGADDYTLSDKNVKPGVDYHTIKWEQRGINLDDVKAPSESLITGLKFNLVGKNLTLQIRSTKFELETGKLVLSKDSSWLENKLEER